MATLVNYECASFIKLASVLKKQNMQAKEIYRMGIDKRSRIGWDLYCGPF